MNGSKKRKQRQLDLNTLLGQRLAVFRHEQGLNQQQVADRMHVKRPLISKIEHGQHTLDAMEIPDYAQALGIQPMDIFAAIDSITVEYDGEES